MNPAQLFRVFPWIETATPNKPGHPLYVHTPQGAGRVDNPEHYTVLYASDEPTGAIGETFGNLATWTPQLLEGPPILPTSRRALVTYEASRIDGLDLDDPKALDKLNLKPSRVVTRDRATTQAWALRVFSERKRDGVRWWSFHHPEWGSFGIWNYTKLVVTEVRPLDDELLLVAEAATILNRDWTG